MEVQTVVLIVGAGPPALATASCLAQLRIPYVIVEREDCSAFLWRNRAYDRLKLHLVKEFCELPHMPYPVDAPTYIPKDQFLKCMSKFLVIASGENRAENIPIIPGLHGFAGETIHSSRYESGAAYSGKNVFVVGCGNSGMEIAYDLASHGANTTIVIRSPVHVVTKEIIRLCMTLIQYIPLNIVDDILVRLSNFVFGDLSKHDILRQKIGPLLLKEKSGRSTVIDVGTISLIKNDTIQVLGDISKIKGNIVEFEGRKESSFDAIVFATGYKSMENMWLKNGESMLNDDGLPKQEFPNHWKGANGLYCASLAKRGFAGIAMDTKNIANGILSSYHART
ncbi:unnamed protein product [Urochloa decumbens]|uniref:Flavin-containing monooxygenase n=1 Tax=Urochloa decumbens TaxID=240449 RepID=A0ABC9AIW9_9POAL